MTVCLYNDDAYMARFTAVVQSAEALRDGRYDIILDRTAFFPEQGGQSADTGLLNGRVRVLDAHIHEGIVHHICDDALPVEVAVDGEVDFGHRFSHMQQHTGEHILSGLCSRTYGCRNVGFHLSDHIVTVDYDKPLSEEQLEHLEDLANRAVWDNLPVRCWFPTAEEAEQLDYRSKKEISGRLRIVSIPGIDDCACCAPHVHTTGEVGVIKIMTVMSYKGGVRLSILCGQRALIALRQKQCRLDQLCRQMTCGEDELPAVLEKRDKELKETRLHATQLEKELLIRDAREARGRESRLLRTENADMQAMITAASCLCEGISVPVGVFSGSDETGYTFCLMAAGGLREFFAGFRKALSAQGGGDDRLIRGKCAASWTEIQAYFESVQA